MINFDLDKEAMEAVKKVYSLLPFVLGAAEALDRKQNYESIDKEWLDRFIKSSRSLLKELKDTFQELEPLTIERFIATREIKDE